MVYRRKPITAGLVMLAIAVTASITWAEKQNETIVSLDAFSCRRDLERECMYFYEQNWKLYRDEALRLGHISGYELQRSEPDSTGTFDVILITRYANAAKYEAREENFRPLMRAVRPSGPIMLGPTKRSELLQFKYAATTRVIHAK
jgi:hypothetical protein